MMNIQQLEEDRQLATQSREAKLSKLWSLSSRQKLNL